MTGKVKNANTVKAFNFMAKKIHGLATMDIIHKIKCPTNKNEFIVALGKES